MKREVHYCDVCGGAIYPGSGRVVSRVRVETLEAQHVGTTDEMEVCSAVCFCKAFVATAYPDLSPISIPETTEAQPVGAG